MPQSVLASVGYYHREIDVAVSNPIAQDAPVLQIYSLPGGRWFIFPVTGTYSHIETFLHHGRLFPRLQQDKPCYTIVQCRTGGVGSIAILVR